MHWLFLVFAIFSEVIATSTLKAAAGFTRAAPTAIVLIGYLCSYYLLSRALETIPLAIAYSVWSGVGAVCIALIGRFFYHQPVTLSLVAGVALVLAGVFVLQASANSIANGV